VKHINFILSHMGQLKYFLPVIIEGNRRGIESRMYLIYDGKPVDYENTFGHHPFSHMAEITQLSKTYGFCFNMYPSGDQVKGVTFFGERRGINHFVGSKDTYRVVLTMMIDFAQIDNYKYYEPHVDKIIMPSRFVAEHYNCMSDKNLYLGSPKYDIPISPIEAMNKYGITSSPNVVVFVPAHLRKKYDREYDCQEIVDTLKEMGFNVIVKARSRNPAPKGLTADRHVEEYGMFPHPSLELLSFCDLAITFDSSVVKECVMTNTPWINFSMINDWLPFEFLYHWKRSGVYKEWSAYLFGDKVENLVPFSYRAKSFHEAREKYLFQPGGVAAKILEAVL